MKRLALTTAAVAFALGAAAPAFAQESTVDPETLTCGQFTELTPDEQARAIVALHAAGDDAASPGMDTTTEETTSDVTGTAESGADSDVTDAQTACAGQDAKLVKDVLGAM